MLRKGCYRVPPDDISAKVSLSVFAVGRVRRVMFGGLLLPGDRDAGADDAESDAQDGAPVWLTVGRLSCSSFIYLTGEFPVLIS